MSKFTLIPFSGAGESGKSTVLKQMRLIHAAGFRSSEREGFRVAIFLNVFTTMQAILESMDMLNLEIKDPLLVVSDLNCNS